MTTTLNRVPADLAGRGFEQYDVRPDIAFTYWLDQMDIAATLAGITSAYDLWRESFICLGDDPDYRLMAQEPSGSPFDLDRALELLGIQPVGTEDDVFLWAELESAGLIEVFPASDDGSDVVAYYRHPSLDPGVPEHLRGMYPAHKDLTT